MNKWLRPWRGQIRRWMGEPRVLWREAADGLEITIEVQGWLPFILLLVTLIGYLADPTPVILMSVVTLGGVLVTAGWWVRVQARGVRAKRRLRYAAMQVGDELEEQISLSNLTALPVIWAEFVDQSTMPDYTLSSARAVDAHSQLEWRAHTICTRRGVFSLGPWELCLGEPFGILRIRQRYQQQHEILVYPPLAALPDDLLPHRSALGDHRPLNQPLRSETIAPFSVRHYAPGDPLRHIHWRTTARRDDPFVKVFAPEAASHIWLIPDFDASVHVGADDHSSEEALVTVCASLAAALLRQNLAVGLLASAQVEQVVLPRPGQAHLWAFLQGLAPLHCAADRPLAAVLERASALIKASDLLLVITPSLKSDWIGALRRSGGTRAEVVLLDPASFIQPSKDFKQAQTASAGQIVKLLLEQGIAARLLRCEDIQPLNGFYGAVSRWDFTVTGSGKAVARSAPRAASGPGELPVYIEGKR